MDEENNEVTYLEDAWDQLISDGIDYLNDSQVTPGSKEYSDAVFAIKELLDTKIKYTEIQMRYENEEAQREHEMKLKRMEYDARMTELEAEERKNEALAKNQTVGFIVDIGKEVLKDCLVSVLPSVLANVTCHEVMVSEYQNDKFVNSTSWRLASNALNKSIKS